MNLLEHEAKAILSTYNLPVPPSVLIHPGEALPDISLPVVVKSQVPTGGRGKRGGIKVVEVTADLAPTIATIFELDIHGFVPSSLLLESKLSIDREFYLSLLINKEQAAIEIIAHTDGGVEVESNDTASFLRLVVERGGPTESHIEQLVAYYGLESHAFILGDFIEHLYRCFVASDATLLEINPLVLALDGKLMVGDCKMTLDDSARFRHPEWQFASTPVEANFVTLDKQGTVATIANGAGLAMATVDAVVGAGMAPANFLDIGGGASASSVLTAFCRIATYPNVKAIVINIFAGITRCDEVARAIIEARAHLDDLPPLCIRLAGTNYHEAAKLLADTDIVLLPTLEACIEAARKEIAHG